ncbi:hypothetical protein ACWD4V_27060 [Streptomyces tsukubensis]|uniref:hypothetical protein n=1 Tax=Streptomyces tsukubensis TaxID=83656 RepID=UPI00368C02BE
MERPLLSLRATLILLLAVLAGLGAGVLAGAAGENTARSVLCGLAATALAVPFFDRLVGLEDRGAGAASHRVDGTADAIPGPGPNPGAAGASGTAGAAGTDGGDRRG